MKSASIIFFFIFCSLQMDAQVHDFDSLYQNSKAFKKYAKSMLDTMDFFNLIQLNFTPLGEQTKVTINHDTPTACGGEIHLRAQGLS